MTHRRPAGRTTIVWVIAGIVMVALSLRAPIIAPTAVIDTIQAGTGLNATGAGLLTALPVLLFAVATPLATRVSRRWGPEVAVVVCLAGVLLGTVVRSAGPASVVLAGTVLIGAAITIGNIVVPVLIRREVPASRVSPVTGLYVAAMNIGSMATLVGTAPLAELVGWRWSIAAWGAVTAAGMLYWLLRIRPGRRRPTEPAAEPPTEPAAEPPTEPAAESPARSAPSAPSASASAAADRRRRRIVILLVLTFSGQAAAYYGTTAWLPLLLAETRGLSSASSGAAASLFQVAAIAGALGVPLLAARSRPWVPMLAVAVCWVTLPVGLLVAPEAFVVWSIIGGAAQGGGFTAIFSIIPRIGGSDTDTARASALVQSGGYLAATFAPPAAGWLYSLSGGWTLPLMLILSFTLVFTCGGLLAARRADRTLSRTVSPAARRGRSSAPR